MTNKTVENEVLEAYADCRVAWEEGSRRRNLSFRASEPVLRDEAYRIMRKAIPGGYNDFKADAILDFDPTCSFWIAREGSVCLYVSGPLPKRIFADEVDKTNTGETRIWWD